MTAIECRRAEMLASILEWATATDNVRALVQTGSLARHDGLADELSDLDIEIVARDPALLIESDAWIHKIGSPVTILHLDAEDGQEWSTRLVIFDAGIKVDFMLVGLPRLEDMSAVTVSPHPMSEDTGFFSIRTAWLKGCRRQALDSPNGHCQQKNVSENVSKSFGSRRFTFLGIWLAVNTSWSSSATGQ